MFSLISSRSPSSTTNDDAFNAVRRRSDDIRHTFVASGACRCLFLSFIMKWLFVDDISPWTAPHKWVTQKIGVSSVVSQLPFSSIAEKNKRRVSETHKCSFIIFILFRSFIFWPLSPCICFDISLSRSETTWPKYMQEADKRKKEAKEKQNSVNLTLDFLINCFSFCYFRPQIEIT